MRVHIPRTLALAGMTFLFAVCASIAQAATLEFFAGNLGGWGNSNGTGSTARFYNPYGVATDSAGNIYVADYYNNAIRKITSAGAVTLLAGGTPGSADGTGAAAGFSHPSGVAIDSANNIYVADTDNHTIRKITPAGVVTTWAGTAGTSGSANGTGAAASFNGPASVAVDSAGNVYVADYYNQTIRKITPARVVTTFAGTAGVAGSANGTGTAASFQGPSGVATDSSGNVYVADSDNHTIRKITPAAVVTTWAGAAGSPGSIDGTGTAASFFYPSGVATDSAGNVYVADRSNSTIRKISPARVVTTFAGTAGMRGSADGTGAAARFYYSNGVATDSAGNVYVADTLNDTIRKITSAAAVTTLAGAAEMRGSTDGTGAAARFADPFGTATDSAGNVYIADASNNVIRKITPAGTVTTLAGTAGTAGSTDGTGAAALFNGPRGITTDSAGNVYVGDTYNNTIRKITPAGVVTTWAGTAGLSGSTNGTGAAARFRYPEGVATDSAGNVYVADTVNYIIRKITPARVVTTLAGGVNAAGFGIIGSANGTGSAARFRYPEGVATNGTIVYVTDTGNHTIRKITAAGVVTTLAGTALMPGSANGTGSAARFNSPIGIATDSAGNIYVADYSNSTGRKITAAGVVTTLVGVANQEGFTPGTLPGILAFPLGMAIRGTSLYITLYNGVAAVRNLP